MEDSNSISSLIEESVNISGEKIFISLSPGASYAFEKHNIAYKSLLDYGGGDERYSEGIENFHRIERLVTLLDKELAHFHDIPTLTPARYSIFNLKILFDVLWTKIHTLKTIIETEHADCVRLYTSFPTKCDFRRYAFSENESVYGEVLHMPGWDIQVEIIQCNISYSSYPRKTNQKETFRNCLISWITNRDFLFNLYLLSAGNGIRGFGKALFYYFSNRKRKPVLAYNCFFNWNESLVELYQSGICPLLRVKDETFDRDSSRVHNYREEVLKVCYSHQTMREFDYIHGIDVSVFFFERVSQIVGESFEESIVPYNWARNKIQQKKISCLLLTVRERATGHALAQAARDAGIPVVSWQHGGAGYCYNPIMQFIEFVNSDCHFVFGDGVAKSYRMTAEKFGLKKVPEFVPVGSSSLDKFRSLAKESQISKADRPIVYITTHYLHNIYIVSQSSDPSFWNEYLWLMQKQFMDLAKKYPEKKFIIKLHPTHKDKEPLTSYANSENIENLQIITSELSLRDLTDIADIMIYDLISTGILQTLTSNLPVFVYSGLHEIDEEVILQLKKRAYVYECSGVLINALDEYIRTRKVTDYPVDTLNSDFIVRFGTDNHSAEKAIAKLRVIIS